MKLTTDFYYEYTRSKGGFSALEHDFIFLNNLISQKGEEKKSLFPSLSQHSDFILELTDSKIDKFIWLVEIASDLASKKLKEAFPDAKILNCSISGYLDSEIKSVLKFLEILDELNEIEPWNNETPWALFGVKKEISFFEKKTLLTLPKYTVEFFLKNVNDTYGIFFQGGRDSFIGVQKSKEAYDLFHKHFSFEEDEDMEAEFRS